MIKQITYFYFYVDLHTNKETSNKNITYVFSLQK